jgi:hypothetical protein
MDTQELTMSPSRTAFKNTRVSDLSHHPETVDEILSEQQAAIEHTAQLGLRKLGFWVQSLIWFLRVYVVFMIVVVIINVMHTIF